MLATELASRAALAVDNAILFSREREARARAEEAVARLRDLEVISEAALTHLDLDRLLQDLLDGVRTVMRTDTAVVLLLDETGDELVASWARGLEEEVEARVRVPVGKGFAGRVAATRQPVFIPDVERAEVVNPLLPKRGLKSLLGVPLLVEGRLLGVLHVGSVTPRVFTNDDERTLQLLADRIALAIEQSSLYESAARSRPAARVPRRGERAARLDARLLGRARAPERRWRCRTSATGASSTCSAASGSSGSRSRTPTPRRRPPPTSS